MTESLAVALARRGHEVAVATLRQPATCRRYEERDGVRVHRLPGLAQRFGALFSEQRAPPRAAGARPRDGRSRCGACSRASAPTSCTGTTGWRIAYLPLRRSAPAAYVLSLHDYSLVCANKRLMRRGAPCDGPGVAKCVVCAARAVRSRDRPAGGAGARSCRAARSGAPWTCSCRSATRSPARCGLASRGSPTRSCRTSCSTETAPAPAGIRAAERLPEGHFILFVGDVATDKGVGILLEAHARMARASRSC